jgi:hypothetical protein
MPLQAFYAVNEKFIIESEVLKVYRNLTVSKTEFLFSLIIFSERKILLFYEIHRFLWTFTAEGGYTGN